MHTKLQQQSGLVAQAYNLGYSGYWGRKFTNSRSTWTMNKFKAYLGNLEKNTV